MSRPNVAAKNHEAGVGDQHEPNSAGDVKAVVGELCEPLLIDPRAPVGPEEEGVVMWEAVLRDLAATHEHHPRVSDQLGAHQDEHKQCDDCDRGDYEAVRLQGRNDTPATVDRERGGGWGLHTAAIGKKRRRDQSCGRRC